MSNKEIDMLIAGMDIVIRSLDNVAIDNKDVSLMLLELREAIKHGIKDD